MSQKDTAAGFRKLEMLQEERGTPTETGERELGKQGEEGRPSAAPSLNQLTRDISLTSKGPARGRGL